MAVPPRTLTLATILTAAVLLASPLPAQEVQIAELTPGTAVTGSGDFTLTIHGVGFVPGVSRVSFGGRNLTDARVTPTSITVRVANKLITERVARDFRDDGIARVTVYVINGPGSVADYPSARKVFYVTRPGVAAATRPPNPTVTAVGPDPAPVGGTLIVRGDHFDAPALYARLLARDPGSRLSSYLRDEDLTRTRTELRIRLADVPPGSYTLRIEAEDAQRHTYATIERPVVVGAPTRLGAPTIARTGPSIVSTNGGTLTVYGTNFADDARVTLAPPGGAPRVLARAPNRTASRTQLSVLVPANLPPGTHTLRVENPGAGTPAARRALVVRHPGQVARRATQGEFGGGATAPVTPPGRRPRGGRPGRPSPRPPAAAPRSHTLAIVANSNLCLVPDADRDGAVVRLQPCSKGGAMYQLQNGYVRTAGDRCLDWGTEGGPIHLMPCKAGTPDRTSQQWYFHGNKLAQNALNPGICMDVEREQTRAGTRVIAYRCKSYDNPATNQRFYPGGLFTWLQVLSGANLSPADQTELARSVQRGGGAAVFSNNARVISAGSGNVIAAGGGNVIAAGAGNVIASGGANVIASGGANVIASGGANVIASGALNLRAVGDPSTLFRGSSVISAGGLNVISSGALNLIGGAGGNLNANLSPIIRP
ncbi:MAG TPA: IPT/TIG domain-containing protein [Gemmatimonadaceae bacterium]|nr:IPT/TIG domain-containing protein [Gemmatimonadaceae bacterium]